VRRSHFIPGDQINKASLLDGFFHPITFSLDDDSFSVVQQSVKQSRSQCAVVVKDLRPILEGTICSNDQRSLFITMTDDLEEQIRAGFIDGQVAKLIQYHQRRFMIFSQFLFQTSG